MRRSMRPRSKEGMKKKRVHLRLMWPLHALSYLSPPPFRPRSAHDAHKRRSAGSRCPGRRHGAEYLAERIGVALHKVWHRHHVLRRAVPGKTQIQQ